MCKATPHQLSELRHLFLCTHLLIYYLAKNLERKEEIISFSCQITLENDNHS